MFRRLTDFGYQRTPGQAFGFYLVYFFGGIIVGGLIGAIIAPFSGVSSFQEGLAFGAKVGGIFAVLLTLTLSFAILWAKGLLGHIGYLLVALLGTASAVLLGMLLGLVFVAFLTTRPASTSIGAIAGPADEGVPAH
jgi:hypothetical protein